MTWTFIISGLQLLERGPSESRRLDDGCGIGMFREDLGIVRELRDNEAKL